MNIFPKPGTSATAIDEQLRDLETLRERYSTSAANMITSSTIPADRVETRIDGGSLMDIRIEEIENGYLILLAFPPEGTKAKRFFVSDISEMTGIIHAQLAARRIGEAT